MYLDSEPLLDMARLQRQLRQEYLYCLYHEVEPMHTQLEQVNGHYCFSFSQGFYVAFYLWGNPTAWEQPYMQAHMHTAREQLCSSLAGFCQEAEVLVMGNRLFGVCGLAQGPQEATTRAFAQCLRRMQEHPALRGCSWTLGLGSYVQALAQLPQSVTVAKHALQRIIVYGPNRLYDGNVPGTVYGGSLTLLERASQLAFVQGMQQLDLEGLELLISREFLEKQAEIERYPTYAYMLTLQLLKIGIQTLRERMPIDRETYEIVHRYEQESENCASLPSLIAHCKAGILELCQRYRQYLQHGAADPIHLVCTYIQGHFTEKLSLSQLGAYANRNPQYLSTQFTKEMGLTISDYITRLRMEKAREYLRTTNETVAQIGRMVGYPDAKYFSRMFCKATGQHPTAYRKEWKLLSG